MPNLRDRLAEALYVDGHHHPNLVDDLLPVVQAAIAEARADERRKVIAEYAAQVIATARESYSNGYNQGRRAERGEVP